MSGSEPIFRDNQRISDLWRGRLLDARKIYEQAATKTKMAGTDFRAWTLPTPDGGANLVGALRAESIARAEYIRTLRIFTDLVISGQGPEE
jgi:hypothetical protein